MTPLTAAASGERRTAMASVGAALVLLSLKLVTGLITGSLALVSAGIESSGDVVAAAITVFAVRLSARPADHQHPYGHRRAENLSALAEAGILLGGGMIVVVEAVIRLSTTARPPATDWYVFAVIAIAVTVDGSRVAVSLASARRYGSAALRSNAFHFAGDMAGSLAVLAGLIAVRAGVAQADAVAALVVAALIFAAAGRLVLENARVLMDTVPLAAEAAAREAIYALGPDVELRRLRLRESAGRYFADVAVGVPPGRAVVEGHATANEVEQAIERALPDSDVVVHVEPRRRGLDLRDQVLAIALGEPLVREAHDITIFEHGPAVSVSLHLKFPPDTPLEQTHGVAERVEEAVLELPRVSDVRTHLEPLEQPVAADRSSGAARVSPRVIEEVVRAQTGSEPHDLRVLPTERGAVVFLTVHAGAQASLAEAHEMASQLEEALRRRVPELADVVVHTEP